MRTSITICWLRAAKGFALRRAQSRFVWLMAGFLTCQLLCGCAALGNPVANGVPVRRLPPELLSETKANYEPISLTLLRQKPADAYILAAGDVLGIWIEQVLGEKGQQPPIHTQEALRNQPAMGFPIPVRKDGTISLPLVEPIKVEGMTLEKVEGAIRKAYTVDRAIIKAGQERIIVTLLQRRAYHVLVIRQDSATSDNGGGTSGFGGRAVGFAVGFGGGIAGSKRGTGFALDLPAYENDVLNALAKTGGFPGTDAANEVVIEKGTFRDVDLGPQVAGTPAKTIRIPLRVRKGEVPNFRPEDVILEDGDTVYIEAREEQVFYTGGILPPGEFVLPRDVDLDVIEAIARVGGTLNSGGLNALNTGGTTTGVGLGSPSPALVTVLRRIPGCDTQVAIRVDLNKALRDPRERLLIQPKDFILMQERPQDAFYRYLSQRLSFAAVWRTIRSTNVNATSTATGP